jgi:transposase-like protein|tara:strand:+ start:491 stop:1744 length:1254 start_codon:yes stop_codon:yes gene_type:complete
MKNDNVISLEKPAENADLLTEMLRDGARELLARAVQAELSEFLAQNEHLTDVRDRQSVVRNGYLPQRTVMTGLGEVEIQVPKTRDRSGQGLHFRSMLLPPYIKRTKSVETVLPWLYLKGISTGDFSEALAALLGAEAAGLSAGTISRLKQTWQGEYASWCKRDLSKNRYVYVWADGVYFNVRSDEAKQCILVVIGVTDRGNKEFLAIEEGYRESEQSWTELLLDLKAQGLADPKLAVGDGAMGFWVACRKVFSSTREQRCWVHKSKNILNKMPKSMQAKAKDHIHEIWMAETRADAEKAFDHFVELYTGKYPKAVECLTRDRETLLTFYDFPAEHWVHIRTSNPIESTFATVRLRTAKTRGCVSRTTILTMVFRLGMSAEKGWRKIQGFRRLAEVVNGVKFIDGIDQATFEQQKSAA